MVNAANQTHAGILNLIAQAVNPRNVETASDLRAEAVARTPVSYTHLRAHET